MSETKKYLVRSASTPIELEDKLNEHAETHYVSQLAVGNNTLIAVLSQRSDGKYDGIVDSKTVPIDEAWEWFIKGWEAIHHTSKEFVLVKRVGTDQGVQE